jgi:hypothetical protein
MNKAIRFSDLGKIKYLHQDKKKRFAYSMILQNRIINPKIWNYAIQQKHSYGLSVDKRMTKMDICELLASTPT